jgi:hypothetical protein
MAFFTVRNGIVNPATDGARPFLTALPVALDLRARRLLLLGGGVDIPVLDIAVLLGVPVDAASSSVI